MKTIKQLRLYLFLIGFFIGASQNILAQNTMDKLIEVEEEEEIIEDVPFKIIEDVPVFPGCVGNKQQLRSCLQDKITQHVSINFNADLASDLGLAPGSCIEYDDNYKCIKHAMKIYRIFIMFKIDKAGDIVDVMARAPHERLKEEAIRVIKLLPKMKPGKQRGRPVGVKYSLPIAFKVE